MQLSFYDSGYLDIFNNTINWAGDNITAILLADAYTPDAVNHSTYSDVKGNEITGQTDYTQQNVPNRSIARNTNEVRWHSDKVSWGTDVSLTARYIVLVQGTAGSLNDTDQLLGYVDLGESKSSSNAEFSFTPASTGWFRVTK